MEHKNHATLETVSSLLYNISQGGLHRRWEDSLRPTQTLANEVRKKCICFHNKKMRTKEMKSNITKEKGKKKKIFLIALAIVVSLMIAGDWALSVMIYEDNFNKRFVSYEPYRLYVDDFEGLQQEKYEFSSNKGQKLTGYLYSNGENQKGIIVLAHGFGGGGHNSYMDCTNYFAKHGYYVFAYDATGNDESEGKGVGGLPQGVIDLDYAISFIEESGKFPNLPICLFGHSWGAYSVCSVLSYHPEVKAVIECSGFNKSSDMFETEGKKQAGNGIYLMLPFVKLHERIKYGDYARNTALDGFKASDADVMIVHSADDNMVPITYGYDKFYKKYKNDSRFHFVRLENTGHNYVYDNQDYITQYFKELNEWVKTLDYDTTAKENQKRFAKDKSEYIHSHLDRSKFCNMLNEELFEKFVKFYDEHLQK